MEIFIFHEKLKREKKETNLCLWQLCYWVVHSVPHPVYAPCSEYKYSDSIFFLVYVIKADLVHWKLFWKWWSVGDEQGMQRQPW